MNETLLHSLQTILSAGLFILIYRLFVRNTNAYNWNRCYLLSTMILSLLLPFIDISSWFTVDKPIIFYASMIDLDQAFTVMPVQQVQTSFNLSDLILTGYWLIVGLFLLRFGWGILRIINMARSNNYSRSDNLRLYPIQRKTTFSFFNYIFIQPEHWEKPAIDYIIRHEQAHVNQLHTIDNILAELILVFGWFNPFYYIYRRDLHLLHECQADQIVINSGCDKTTYHQMLLNEVSGNLTYIIVNQFSYSLIKRRFKMISKNKQSRLAGFRILLAIPTAFALLLMFSFTSLEKTTSLLQHDLLKPTMQAVQSSLDNLQNPQQKPVTKQTVKQTIKFTPPVIAKDQDTAKQNAERRENSKRGFPGGHTAWLNYLKTNAKFPPEAAKNGHNSYIEVSFNVSETGEIKNAKVGKGIDATSDKEALRLTNMMPKWIPFLKNGKPTGALIHMDIMLKPDPNNADLPPIATFSGISRGPIPNISDPDEDKPALLVEQNPEFIGGYEAMLKYLRENIHYPAAAQQSKIQGTTFVQFVISKTGKISKVKILRGIGGGCDEEAIRVVREMPDWIPGRNNGKAVTVMFQIPVKFQLKAF